MRPKFATMKERLKHPKLATKTSKISKFEVKSSRNMFTGKKRITTDAKKGGLRKTEETGKSEAEKCSQRTRRVKTQVKSESVNKKFKFSKIKPAFGKITRRRIRLGAFDLKKQKKNLSIKISK